MELSSHQALKLSTTNDAARAHVDMWRARLAPIYRAKHSKESVVQAMKSVSEQHGVAFGTVRNWWYRFSHEGVEGLIDKRKNPRARGCGLPHAFLQFWKSLLEQHQRDRTGKEAHRKLIRQWRAWLAGDQSCAIPGYDSPPEPQLYHTYPVGWSVDNLRRHGLSKAIKKLRRQGTMAMKDCLPSVRTTRVGIDFMEMVMVDDQWHDELVNFINERGELINRKATRPLSFNALEVLSGCDFAAGYKPIIWDDFLQKKVTLSNRDFFWFIINILTNTGWRAEGGTTIVGEHGTSNMPQAWKDRITQATDGGVRFSAGGILGAPLRKGMFFEGQPRGNFKFKAHRESWFSLFRNYCSSLPVQTGLNPKMAPEENYGIVKYNNLLLRAMDQLGPERAALLVQPMMNWHQFVPLAERIRELINRRHDHQLEGWEELGHVAQLVRLDPKSDQWLSLADIARMENPHAQQMALSLMQQPGHGMTRRLSPREVFEQGKDTTGLTKLNPHLWNVIMPSEFAHTVKVNERHEIIIRDREVSPRSMVYLSHVRTQRGREEIIPAGETVLVYCNPFMPGTVLVCEPDDSAIGLATLMDTPVRTDLDGMTRVAGTVATLRAHLSRESAARAEGIMRERAAMKEHNAAVMAGQAVTPDQIEGAQTADDILSQDIAPALPEEVNSNWDPLGE